MSAGELLAADAMRLRRSANGGCARRSLVGQRRRPRGDPAFPGGEFRRPERGPSSTPRCSDPFYEPNDRLLLRRSGRIIAHVHLTHRVMQFGPVKIPVAGLGWLATRRRAAGKGLGTHLLAGGRKAHGPSGGPDRPAADPHPPLLPPHRLGPVRPAHLRAPPAPTPCSRTTPGPRTEPAPPPPAAHPSLAPLGRKRLARIYQQNVAGSYGPCERSRAYWHWLLERQAYDQIYVALDGPDLWDLKEASTRLVGYAAVKGERVVELMTAPGRQKARPWNCWPASAATPSSRTGTASCCTPPAAARCSTISTRRAAGGTSHVSQTRRSATWPGC